MTPQPETTATRSASAVRRRGFPGRLASAFPPILGWPTLVWLIGSTPWLAAAIYSSLTATAANGESSVAAMAGSFLWIGTICFGATVASLLPIRPLASGPADALPLGLLATIAVRGSTTLILLIGSIAAGLVDRESVALPIVLWYMAFLITDLVVVNRFLSDALPISARPHRERTTC